MSAINVLISDHVRHVMDQRGLQVRDVASMAALSPAKVERRLDGRTSWYLNEVEALADAVDVSPVWFLEQDNI